MSTEAVLQLSKKLDKIISGEKPEDAAGDILNVLKTTPVTIEVLQKTRIGMTVNELRKRVQSKEVQSEAKNLIKTWKKLLDEKPKEKDKLCLPRTESMASNMSVDSNSNDIPDASASQDSDPGLQLKLQNNTTVASTNGGASVKSAQFYDDFRNKSRELLLKSLTSSELPPDCLDPELLATQIEECIFEAFNSTNEKYRACIRSRVFNLRDKKNPDLRDNVLLGALKPQRLAIMTPEEMASSEMKTLRKTMTKEAINEHQITQETGTPTDMFKCGRCGRKNCTYTQAQTRSADEPMTTFVFCRDCGYRWKFC